MSSTSPIPPNTLSLLDRDPASLTPEECLDAAVELAKSGFYTQFREFVEHTTLNFTNLTFTQKRECLDMLRQVSGLAKRQETPKDVDRFVININTGAVGGPKVTIDAAPVVDSKQADVLASVRAAARTATPEVGDIDFTNAPEFS